MHVDDEARRGAERIGAQRHRHGAGMPAVTRERELQARHARDRADDAERRARRRERRALLDVQLDEARRCRLEPAGARQLAEPERRERLGQGDAVGVAQIALVVVELAADRAAAEHAAAEARALLETKGDDHETAARRTFGADRLGGVERAEHAKGAVEAASVGRRVEMRTAPDLGQIRLAAGQPAHQVARRIAR